MTLAAFISENIRFMLDCDYIFILSCDKDNHRAVLNQPDEQSVWFGRDSLPPFLLNRNFRSLSRCDSLRSLNDAFSEYVLDENGNWDFRTQDNLTFRNILESSPLAADTIGKMKAPDKSIFLTVE